MNKKRQMLALGLVVSLVVAGFTGFLWLTTGPNHRITEENFAKIQAGMTEKEVEEILGGPPGDYSLPEHIIHYPVTPKGWMYVREWRADEFAIFVSFSFPGHVVDHHKWKRKNFLDKVSHWLHLPW